MWVVIGKELGAGSRWETGAPQTRVAGFPRNASPQPKLQAAQKGKVPLGYFWSQKMLALITDKLKTNKETRHGPTHLSKRPRPCLINYSGIISIKKTT